MFWTVALATLFWTPIAWWQAGPPSADWAPGAFWNMAYLGLIATSVGFVTWYMAVKHLGADRAGPGLGLVPAFGVVLAVVFLGERLLWTHVAGGLVVVLGIALSGFDGTLRLRLTRRFDQPLDTMWARATDFGGLHQYSPDLQASDILEGDAFAVGTLRRNVFLKPQAGITHTDERITQIEGTSFGYDVVGGIGPYPHAEATWDFQAEGTGTRLVYEATLRAGLIGWLLWLPTKRNLRGGLTRMLDRLGA
mgnify:FL=1